MLFCRQCIDTVVWAGLPQTKLGTYLENRVNLFLKRKDAGAGEVTIRVLSSSDKVVEVRPGMKTKFCTPGMLLLVSR